MNDQLTREQKAELVRDALRQVMDPEIGLSVTELGLLREVQVEDDHTHLIMILTTPFCPYAPQLLEASRQKAQRARVRPRSRSARLWDPALAKKAS